MYTCKRCGYTTPLKGSLVTHLKRKNPCPCTHCTTDCSELLAELAPQRVGSYKCEWCDTTFTQLPNKYRHKKICKNRVVEEPPQNSEPYNNLVAQITSLIETLKAKETSHVTNVTNHVTNNVNLIVQLNKFGEEQLDHISPDNKTEYVLNMANGFTRLIKHIHFHEDMPSNNNIRYKSYKQNIIEVLEDDNTWVEHDAGWVLDKMVNKGWKILQRHLIENISSDVFVDNHMTLNAFLQKIACKHGKEYRGIKREIFMIIKNHTGKTLYVVSGDQGHTHSNLALELARDLTRSTQTQESLSAPGS